jgi:hypothetical protein
MSDNKEILLDILCEILGEPEKVYDTKLQYGYNCPECGVGLRKGYLVVSLEKHLFHCWGCGDMNNMKGPLGKLIDIYGSKKQKKVYDLVKPEELKLVDIKKPKLRIAEGYTTFADSNPKFIPHIEAYRYLKSRGITDEIIEKYKIGYTVTGDFAYRIIVPSYNSEGVLNYFIARAWIQNKIKYKNPTAEKNQIIFNEGLIDWNKDIYICEGAFDSFFLDNPLVMLGKKMSDLIFNTIYNKANGNIIICLDEDAWTDALKLYHTLNGGRLYNKIKIIKPPKDMDVADLRGKIDEYYYEIK